MQTIKNAFSWAIDMIKVNWVFGLMALVFVATVGLLTVGLYVTIKTLWAWIFG